MKQIMLFFILSFFMLPFGIAQNSHSDKKSDHRRESHEGRMKKIVNLLDEQVTLTADQQSKIKLILEQTSVKINEVESENEPIKNQIRKKIEAIRSSDLSKDEKREKIGQIKEEYAPQISLFREKLNAITTESKKEINNVLTVEQKAVLYEILSEKESKKKEKFKKK